MSLRRSTRIHGQVSEKNAVMNGVDLAVKKRALRHATSGAVPAKKSRAFSDHNGSSVKITAVVNNYDPRRPGTPLRQRNINRTSYAPVTPTPSLANIFRAPYSSGDIDDATPPPLDRPVEPHVSNATLVTPGGTQNVAYSTGLPLTTSSKLGLPQPSATTGTLLEKACAHLISVDSRFRPIIERYPCSIFSPTGLAEEIDPFRSLSSGIMGQQVSGAAAKAIKNKFVGLFNSASNSSPVFPTPTQVAKEDITRLRLAGLSQRKAEYIKGLAEKFVAGEITSDMLMKASDVEVMETLIAVRGLGRWSVEMFACFGLKRMDILSVGDLGVQRGMAAFFGKDVKRLKAKGGGKWKYMSEQDMLDKSAPFAPYRSLFMWYMWRVEDVDVAVMQDE